MCDVDVSEVKRDVFAKDVGFFTEVYLRREGNGDDDRVIYGILLFGYREVKVVSVIVILEYRMKTRYIDI